MLLIKSLMTLAFLSSTQAWGQSATEWQFQSPHDRFKIVEKGGSAFLGNTEVSLAPLSGLADFFAAEAVGDCPTDLKTPDLTVTKGAGKNAATRNFYMAAKTFSDGKNCGSIEGIGVYSFPLHRTWFTGSDRLQMQLTSPWTLRLPDGSQRQFVEADGAWTSPDPVNWEFFDRVLPALKSFTVTGRLHPEFIKTNPRQFTITSDREVINFYMVGDNLWAAQLPKVKWLISSKDWSLLQDMGSDLWRDRHGGALEQILNKTLPAGERVSAIASLGPSWSRSIRQALHRVLLDEGDAEEVRMRVALSLRQKPTDDNFRALAHSLSPNASPEFLAHVTKILRIKQPKGPVIKDDSNAGHIQSTIQFWRDWADKLPRGQ